MPESSRSLLAPPACDDAAIWRVWLAAFHAPSLAVADELGLFRALDTKAADARELSQNLGVELRAIESLAALMTSLEFLIHADGRFHLTEVARHYLLPESPYYWGGLLGRVREAPIDCARLIASLRRGTTQGHVAELWEAPKPPPERLRSFTHAMHAHSMALAVRATPLFDLSAVRSMLDVGGGSGSYSLAAAARHANLRCAVLDLPPVCEVALEYIERFALRDRVDVAPTDMFAPEAWPPGYDRIFFSDIFHAWDDELCAVLAQRAHAALPSGGRVHIHEMLLSDAKDGPLQAAAFSMLMVFAARGRQRTARELMDFLSNAGFVDLRVAPTASGYSLVEGTKR